MVGDGQAQALVAGAEGRQQELLQQPAHSEAYHAVRATINHTHAL